MRRVRVVAKDSVEIGVTRLPFLLMASEEALRFATTAMTEEERKELEDRPGLAVQAAYWEGQRDAYYNAQRMLTKREMYETTEATFPELDDDAIDSGFIRLPIPPPQ